MHYAFVGVIVVDVIYVNFIGGYLLVCLGGWLDWLIVFVLCVCCLLFWCLGWVVISFTIWLFWLVAFVWVVYSIVIEGGFICVSFLFKFLIFD